MRHFCHARQIRLVSDFGETLIVRFLNGSNALVDPCDQSVVVEVPVGRRAKLVRYPLANVANRDAYVLVTRGSAGLGFVSAKYPLYRVLLDELCPGQLVDILPTAEPAAAYAALPRPLPVFSGAVAAPQPVYAALAA